MSNNKLKNLIQKATGNAPKDDKQNPEQEVETIILTREELEKKNKKELAEILNDMYQAQLNKDEYHKNDLVEKCIDENFDLKTIEQKRNEEDGQAPTQKKKQEKAKRCFKCNIFAFKNGKCENCGWEHKGYDD
jgi:hypothetical protein